jgi:hypothetical protein
MIYDLNKVSTPSKPKPVAWASLIKLVIIVAVLVWMENRDREHMADNAALVEVVMTQAQVIEGMECGVGLEMIVPIGLES